RQRAFDKLHGAAVEVQLAALQQQPQTRCRLLALIDAVATKQQQMNANRQALQLDQQVLAPTMHRRDALTGQMRFVQARIALGSFNALADEGFKLFAQDDNGWPFGHGCLRLGFLPQTQGSQQGAAACYQSSDRSEEHTSELQSRENLVCRLLLEKKKK